MVIRFATSTLLCLTLLGVGVCNAEVVLERSIGESRIIRVDAQAIADLVVLDDGYQTGFRQGMVCKVSRSGASLGELIIVDLRSKLSTALILNIATGQTLQRGDIVTAQTVSSRNN
jgi:hypothetical protein